MIVNQPYEVYTLALGFFLNNRIWELLIMTGVAYIPIIIMIINSVAGAYQGGDDEGDRGSVALRHIEMGILRIFVIMVFALIPNGTPFKTNNVTYEINSCVEDFIIEGKVTQQSAFYVPLTSFFGSYPIIEFGDNKVASGTVEISQGMSFNISGTQPRPPYVLEFVHNLSSQAVNSIIKTMPCEADIAGVSVAMGELEPKTQDSQAFLTEMVKQCYSPSLLNEMSKRRITSDEIQDDYWIGSDNLRHDEYTRQRLNLNPDYWVDVVGKLRQSTNFLDTYNYNSDIHIVDNNRASPLCETGYRVLELYIKRDFKSEIHDLESGFMDGIWETLYRSYPNWFVADADFSDRGVQSIIKRLTSASTSSEISADAFKEQTGDVTSGKLDYVLSVLGDTAESVALVDGYLNTLIQSTIHKSLAYPLTAIIQCFLIVITPILLLFSGYSFKTLGTILITLFGLEFLHLVFELCAWMENTLINLSSSAYSNWRVSQFKTKAAIYNATSIAYILLPMVWFTLLGKVGGGLEHIGGAIASGGGVVGSKASARVNSGITSGAKAGYKKFSAGKK